MLLDKLGEFGIVFCCVCRKRMFWGNRTKGNPHNGVGACCENVETTILDELAGVVFDVVSKRKSNPFAFADPVFLHNTNAFWPALEPVFNVFEKLFSVIGNA